MARTKATLILLGVLVYLLLPYRWALHTRSNDNAAARQVRGQTAIVSARVARARSVLADPAGWAARVRATEAAFPPVVDVSGEVTELRAAAAASGVRIISISSDAPPVDTRPRAAPPTHESVQIRLEITGTTPAVEGFLSHLRSAARLFTSTRETIDFADPSVTVDLTAQMWTLPRTSAP